MSTDLKPAPDWMQFDGFNVITDLAGGLMAVGIVLCVGCLVGGAILLGWSRISKTKPKSLVHPRVVTALYAALAIGAIGGLVGFGIDKMPAMQIAPAPPAVTAPADPRPSWTAPPVRP